MKFRHLIAVIPSLLLTACQTTPLNYDHPRSIPPVGSTVVLHQSLSFSAGTSRSNIQDGKALGSSGKYNRFQPWCQFYLYEPRAALKQARKIAPDRFDVVKARQEIDYSLALPVRLAAIGFGMGTVFGDDPGMLPMVTVITLHSEKQPQVHQLRCSVTTDTHITNFLSVNQIRATLGEVATLELPPVAQ